MPVLWYWIPVAWRLRVAPHHAGCTRGRTSGVLRYSLRVALVLWVVPTCCQADTVTRWVRPSPGISAASMRTTAGCGELGFSQVATGCCSGWSSTW
jgi:hypothetical protein